MTSFIKKTKQENMLIIKKSITVEWRKHIHKLVKLLSNRVGLFILFYMHKN